MKRAFLSFSKTQQIAAIAFLAVSAFSPFAVANNAPKAVKADLVKGEALYTNGDATRGIVACVSCHGAAGNSTISINPKLAGQHEAYVAKQLSDFTTPNRQNAVMTTFAKLMTHDDMKNVAGFLAMQKPKAGAAKNKDIVELGKQIYRGGIAEKSVPACAGCHSPNGAGIPAQFPRLAGQHQDYTVAQLTAFKNHTRKNSEQMSTIATRMSDEEMKAVADYVAGLK
jgi:cytochrome c553